MSSEKKNLRTKCQKATNKEETHATKRERKENEQIKYISKENHQALRVAAIQYCCY